MHRPLGITILIQLPDYVEYRYFFPTSGACGSVIPNTG